MKKFFTLICALVATVAASAASVDDIALCKHSLVFVFDDYTNNGTAGSRVKGGLFADGFILDLNGGSVATNKQKVNPANYEKLAEKYADYAGDHYNSLRIKNGQDQIVMKVTAGSKVIILGQTSSNRWPAIQLSQVDYSSAASESVDDGVNGRVIANDVPTNGYYEWEALNDETIYIGSHNGDYYIGMIIVEANEAAGTPSVKATPQEYDGGEGMWYSLVTCKPVADVDGIPTCCTYTTDGTEPTAESPVYTEPIKVYKDCVVKFQAFYDYDGVGSADELIEDATNDAIVTFKFNAPTIDADGANVVINSEYDGVTNYYSINGGEWIEGDSFTLEESATVAAKSVVENGEDDDETPIVFESKSTTKDVYVLTPIAEKTVITVSGKAVVDEEATNNDPNHNTQYMVEDGAISADKAHFFVKNLVLAAIADPQYQIDGQEAYIQMSNTTIDFELAEAAAVTVICSKNSAKNLDTDKQCKITVDGNTYGGEDVEGTWNLVDAEGITIEELPGNVVKFDLEAGHHQFKKYSGTGAIKIASITIEPGKSVFAKSEEPGGEETAIKNVNAASAAKTVKAIENGQLVIKSAKGTFSVAGAQMK